MIYETKKSFDEIIDALPDSYKVVDVGGAGAPTRRADYIIDLTPYEKMNMNQLKGPGEVRFNQDRYINIDICARQPLPFPDKFFDYSICSHTLEDIRDPLWVCSELIRVSKAGYIETPSKFYESTFGIEAKTMAGAAHHHWILELENGKLRFSFKLFFIHIPFLNRHKKKMNTPENINFRVEWSDSFEYFEKFNGVGESQEMFSYFLGHPVSEKEMWKIYRKLSPRNFVSRWLRYLKNTNPLFAKIYSKLGDDRKKSLAVYDTIFR